MKRINHQGQWNILNGRTWQVKILRGGAEFLGVNLINNAGGTVNYFVQEIAAWDSHMDEIFGTTAGVPSGRSVALGALDYIPMHDGLYTNQGTRGGTAALIAGALGNTTPWYDPAANQIYQQVSNGYVRLVTTGLFSSYNGPFTIGMWIYPTLVSALTPIYTDQNNVATHYLQAYLDTDRRIGFRGSNGVSTFNVKDAAGPQVVLNQWTLVIVTYSAPNYQYTLLTPTSGAQSTPTSVGAGGLPTFLDSQGTFMGFVGSTNGFIGAPFTLNSVTYNGVTTAPMNINAMTMLSNEWGLSYNGVTQLDSGTLAVGGKFAATYGKGASKPFPAVTVIGFSFVANDAAGFYSITQEKGD